MTDLLRVGATVATPIGLIGFVVAVLALLYQRQLRHQEEQLKALPPEQRAQSVDRFLSRYGLAAGNLTREQKFQLLQHELEKRFRTVQLGVVASATTFLACVFFGVGAYLIVNQTPGAWGALLAALLMVTAAGVGLYALNRWAPGKPAAAAVDSFAELRSDLEEANRIVQTLDSTFIGLARRYADLEMLLDPQQRQALITDTDRYLYDRVLLPRLLEIQGSLESKKADASRGRKVKELPGLLEGLAGRIQEYRFMLGTEGGPTGVGRDALMQLWNKARAWKGANDASQIVSLAETTRRDHSHRISEEIQLAIGKIKSLL